MVTTNDEIKVIDFGLSKNARSVTNHQIVGTPFYIAPEIIQDRPYDTQVDIWSLGVLLYVMLSGHYPFTAHEPTVLFEKIALGLYSFKHEEFDSVSSEGKDLIAKMLVIEPKLRLTASQILKHPWFNKFGPAQTVTKSVDQLDVKTFAKLRSYKGVSHFKRAAMNILIKMSSEEQLH
jgi:serine/threonine protein kinase